MGPLSDGGLKILRDKQAIGGVPILSGVRVLGPLDLHLTPDGAPEAGLG